MESSFHDPSCIRLGHRILHPSLKCIYENFVKKKMIKKKKKKTRNEKTKREV